MKIEQTNLVEVGSAAAPESIELGAVSEKTNGTISGPLIETSALPFRVF
jgi:hypothetical protein